MKKFLAKQEGVVTKKQLQRQLDRFVSYSQRGPSPPGGRTPNTGRRLPSPGEDRTLALLRPGGRSPPPFRPGRQVRAVTLRHRGQLRRIGIGTAYKGWRVAMLVEGLDIEIVGLDELTLRRLVLDPTKDYQRIP